MTQKEIIFAGQKFYPLTDDQKNKLNNYDNLQSQAQSLNYRLNTIKGTWSWSRNNNSSFNNGKDSVQVNVSDDGVIVILKANTGNLGTIELKKK